ncbi:MAG TPA: ATP-binding protein [Noviherbaspirillum sp.]
MDSQAAALIIHDIKNALSVLEGELQALSLEPERERAQRASRDCAVLREKLVGFLTLYTASSGSLRARVEALSPEDFLKGWLADSLHARSGVVVEIDAAEMPPLAFFDEYLVGLALDAALQNAVRFARTRVQVACRSTDTQGVSFEVRDDGAGLGQDGGRRSTGLGTELCRAVAAAHRSGERVGRCRLYDGGSGAVFELHLP